jgi:hypothetical protein
MTVKAYLVKDDFRNTSRKVMIHSDEHFGPEADMASKLVTHWGMVSARPDGEDSSGRAKLDLMSPEDVVRRACDTTALFFEEVRKRGWIFPSISQEDYKKYLGAEDAVDD